MCDTVYLKGGLQKTISYENDYRGEEKFEDRGKQRQALLQHSFDFVE